ncbi:MAG TPA: ferric reductase-like transmembrane domain-containing protein [Gaiellaceae bacterium]|nr:ferric reductase-like transmembrane domain-containing protein [Gaiellaceae bacterium]
MHLTSNPIDWYAARAAGVVAYLLLTVVVSLGLTMSSRRRLPQWPRFALEEVHRFGGILVGTFVAIHVVTIAIDSYLRFSLTAMLVPFVSSYRPLWVALGIVAAELLLALAITNRLRDRMPYARWRTFHYANFAVWTAATVHGMASGTDRSSVWLMGVTAACAALVVSLTALRVRLPRLPALAAGSGAAAIVLVLALVAFPFHPRLWNATTFHDSLAGVISRNAGPTREIVSVTATGDGEQRVLMRADLLVEPQGLLDTSFQLEFLPSGLICRGRVTHIDSLGFEGSCNATDGTSRFITAAWEQESGPAFSQGTLDVHA